MLVLGDFEPCSLIFSLFVVMDGGSRKPKNSVNGRRRISTFSLKREKFGIPFSHALLNLVILSQLLPVMVWTHITIGLIIKTNL